MLNDWQRAELYRLEQWRQRAFAFALTLWPRVEALNSRFYAGCGFHYSLRTKMKGLLGRLYGPYLQEGDSIWKGCIDSVCLESLANEVVKAERSAIELAKETK